jgi:predicted RNase H-like HicB family nuclease
MAVRKKKQVFQVIVERDEEGFFVAECPSLRACYAQGKTYDEAIENVKDVIVMCLDALKSQGEAVPTSPQIVGIQPVEVAV